jgi:glycosyltransferase involved in cell wall biosynthesis
VPRVPVNSRSVISLVKVLYFGTYERQHPRNAQVISCLRSTGVEVLERHEPVWEDVEHKWALGAGAAARLAAAEARLLARPGPRADIVLVGYPGHLDVVAARRAARSAPLVLNPLVSLFDTFVADRGRFRTGSLAARALLELDRRAFRSADVVVADTQAQARLFAELGARRVETIFLGAEERLFTPGWAPPVSPTCLFVGKLIPLHGVDVILAAASVLPDIRFRLVGSGQLTGLLDSKPPNVEHIPWLPYGALADDYRGSSIALGVFGTTAKAARVIPNKAFQAIACGTPLVTADTPAVRELLRDGESALLVPPGDPAALAAAIQRLAAEPMLARRLSEGGLGAYRAHANEQVLGRQWRALLEQLR